MNKQGVVKLKGKREQVEKAKQAVEAVVEDNKELNEDLIIGADVGRMLVGRRGARVRQLERESGAAIRVGKDGVVRVRGKRRRVEAAKLAIENMVQGHAHDEMYINTAQISALVGRKGATISTIESNSGATIQVEKDGLITLEDDCSVPSSLRSRGWLAVGHTTPLTPRHENLDFW